MKVAGLYSFNNGRAAVEDRYPDLMKEVYSVVESVDAESCRTKSSEEKTMLGRVLYSPVDLNREFKASFSAKNWQNYKVHCEYPTEYYTKEYARRGPLTRRRSPSPFRDMDYVKNRLGVEVQFGKYAFMVYNVCAKMTIFRNMGIIDMGIEIVPVKQFADEMSTGVSYFEQFLWDLKQRGVSDIDIPVLIIGVDSSYGE